MRVAALALMAMVVASLGATAAPPAKNTSGVCNRVRILPATGHEKELLGGTIRGSNVSAREGFEVLAEIRTVAQRGKWAELSFPNKKPYRWIKYEGAAGSYGWIAKIEFYAGSTKLMGPVFASYPLGGWRKALEEKRNGQIHGDDPDGQHVGIDVGEKASCPKPIVTPAGGECPQAITVTMHSRIPGALIRYTTDGTLPTLNNGQTYTSPLPIDKTATLSAVAFREGMAPSPAADEVYLFHPVHRNTLHLGNSLTGNAVGKFALHARTAGAIHQTNTFAMGGGLARMLWNAAMIGVGDPKDQARWHDLFTTTHSMGGVATYSLSQVEKAVQDWKQLWPALSQITDVTFQPRDADISEEAEYVVRWLNVVRQRFPDVQPWLYIEWTERDRKRATDLGQVASFQMSKVFPAVTWEEAMSAMMLYGEEVQHAIAERYRDGKRVRNLLPERPDQPSVGARCCAQKVPDTFSAGQDGRPMRIIPVALALGWIHQQIEQGTFPDAAKDSFCPLLFNDHVHLNPEGCFLLEATWYAALYGQSPEGKFLPLTLQLTPKQSLAMQRLAWDVVKNYPDCGLYEQGTAPVGKPEFTPAAKAGDVTPVTIGSATPGAWFRYTLDGTVPTRTRGYIYCGVVSVRPGMTLKAIAYKSGMADSRVAEAAY